MLEVAGSAGEEHYFTLNNYLIRCNHAKILQSFARNSSLTTENDKLTDIH